mgnify:FL=1
MNISDIYNIQSKLVQYGASSNVNNGSSGVRASEEQVFEEKLRQAMSNNDDKALKEACQQFETLFLQMLYRQMKATVPKSDLFPENLSKDIFESMLDEALMEEASKGNGIGLADMMYKQLSRNMKSKK